MTLAIPDEHKKENLNLVGEPYVDLFEIVLKNGTHIYLKNNEDVNWGGHTWEGYPVTFSGYEISSEKLSRPSMKLINPEGVFSSIFISGDLDKSTINRYRVLRRDIDADRPVYQLLTWILWNIKTITKDYVEFELRNPMDGNNFYIPARQYIPPEFTLVTLG